MKKYKFISLALISAIALACTVGCSNTPNSSTGDGGTVVATEPNNNVDVSELTKNNGIAQNEITANPAEEAKVNETTFKLNRVIDSGKTNDDGDPYVFLDVTISNTTENAYDLSIINNFYLLLPDNSEVHFDVRTQLYATQNIDGYFTNPFNIPSNGEFSGIIGGFVLPKDTADFTVCFFPTQNDASNKTNVIKINVSSQNIEKLS